MAGIPIADTELLIAAVEQRPALWMARHREHKNKFVKAALWREVAAAVMPVGVGIEEGVELVQKRWKSLRDKFRRLFFAHKDQLRSGASQEDAESLESSWPFFDALLFLKDTMQTRDVGQLHVISNEPVRKSWKPVGEHWKPGSEASKPGTKACKPSAEPCKPASEASKPNC
ncbi:uncharacterized protein [Dermacentor andersoni]|uniref:uncharacterized protein n=1 Tax=Dermacentor andersoni TaxID=34620 RepID=UPI003B3BA914